MLHERRVHTVAIGGQRPCERGHPCKRRNRGRVATSEIGNRGEWETLPKKKLLLTLSGGCSPPSPLLMDHADCCCKSVGHLLVVRGLSEWSIPLEYLPVPNLAWGRARAMLRDWQWGRRRPCSVGPRAPFAQRWRRGLGGGEGVCESWMMIGCCWCHVVLVVLSDTVWEQRLWKARVVLLCPYLWVDRPRPTAILAAEEECWKMVDSWFSYHVLLG